MNRHGAGYIRFRRRVAIGYVVLCALLVSLLLWKVTASYLADRSSAVSTTRQSARAMAAHVEEIVDAIDLPLRRSVLDIAALHGKPMTPEAIQPLLAGSSRAADSRFWLLFIDASGKGVVASNGLAVGGVSFADRSYFSDPAQNRADQLHVGPPAFGRVSKRRLFFLSRRVESTSGKFLGVVAAPVDASRVASVFDKARLGPAMSISLVTRDNRIIARVPQFEESFGIDVSDIAASLSPVASDAPFEAASPFGGERRLFSYAPVANLPLFVIVGVTRESWIAGFRSDLKAGFVGLAVALFVALLSGKYALDQYARLERVEEMQRALIAQLVRAKEELARGERRLRIIADSVPARIFYINADERYTFHNAGEYGAPTAASMGKTLLETHGEAVYAVIKDDVHRALAGERVCVVRSYALEGTYRYFKHQYAPDLMESGRAIGFHAMVTDITEFKTIEQRLAAMARVDTLTGLPNRLELLDRLENALARCRRTGLTLAVLYLDIDRFKQVNDTFGHSGGDHVLMEFSRRLRLTVRESDTVARLAGDEFVIALDGMSHPAEAARVAEKIIESMTTPFDIEGTAHLVTTSVGMFIASPATNDARSLLRAADAALYRAKRAGRNRFEIGADTDGAAPQPAA